jgi:hypothetical protein
MEYRARVSKKMTILSVLSCCIFILVFSTTIIFPIVDIFIESRLGDFASFNIFMICMGTLFECIIIIILIVIIKKYKYQEDIYTEHKMYRTMKGKKLFEINYSEIEKITIDPFWGMIFFCNVNFKKRAGLKNGGKTLCEHYTRKDVHHIRQMIVKNYFNRIKFN